MAENGLIFITVLIHLLKNGLDNGIKFLYLKDLSSPELFDPTNSHNRSKF